MAQRLLCHVGCEAGEVAWNLCKPRFFTGQGWLLISAQQAWKGIQTKERAFVMKVFKGLSLKMLKVPISGVSPKGGGDLGSSRRDVVRRWHQ